MQAQKVKKPQRAPKFKKMKAEPFGAHFTTKLEGANNKLVCALSVSGSTTCTDDNNDPIYV